MSHPSNHSQRSQSLDALIRESQKPEALTRSPAIRTPAS